MRLCRKPKLSSFNHEEHEGHEVKNKYYFIFIFVPLRVFRGEITIGRIQKGIIP
jgi:hypothetical protein